MIGTEDANQNTDIPSEEYILVSLLPSENYKIIQLYIMWMFVQNYIKPQIREMIMLL